MTNDGWEDAPSATKDGWEDAPTGFSFKDSLKAVANKIEPIGHALGDIGMGFGKIPLATLGAVGAKIARPSENLEDLWKASNEYVDSTNIFPQFGKENKTSETPEYKAMMYPFQKFGEGIDWTAEKAKEIAQMGGPSMALSDNAAKDIKGAIQIAGNFLPIPGAKILGKFIDAKEAAAKNRGDRVDALPPLEEPPPAAPRVPEQMELPLQNNSQQIAEMQNRGSGQKDLFASETENNGQPTNIAGPSIQSQVFIRRLFDEQAARLKEQEAAAQRAGDAQAVIDARQKQMELDVQRQTSLDQGAAERARQENAPVAGLAEARARETDASTARTQDLNTRGQQMAITEDYGNNNPMSRMPEMRVDENGIPIRADLSMEVANLENPLQRNLWGDELPAKHEQEGVPLTQAIDNMAPAERSAAIRNELAGGDIHAPPDLIKAIEAAAAETGGGARTGRFGGGQRGSAGFINDIAKLVEKGLDKFNETGERLGSIGLHHLTTKDDYLSKNIPGMRESLAKKITPAPKAEEIISSGLDPKIKDIDALGNFTNTQSGPMILAAKFRDHPVILGMGRVLHEAVNKTEYQIDKIVKPIQETYSRLGYQSHKDLAKLFLKEMFAEKRYTPEQLAAGKFSKKEIDAYHMQRAAFDALLDAQNKSRADLGRPPITAKDAYLSSIRKGSWQFAVLDKEGNPAWFVRENTRGAAKAALEHLKKNFPELAVDKATVEYRKEGQYNPNVPQDVMGAYSDMLKHFADRPELADHIRESIDSFLKEKGYDSFGHKSHFLEKSNIRGFEGDKPWRSDSQNAHDLLNGQVQYMKSAIQWGNLQEAMATTKKVLANPELASKMPNAHDYLTQLTSNHFGLTSNVIRTVEGTVAKFLGQSPSALYKTVGGVKSALYLQLLGANPSHFAATLFNAIITGPAEHRLLSVHGMTHSAVSTILHTMADATAGLARHSLHDMSGKDVSIPMSEIGERALKFGEDNGVFAKNVFNESGALGGNAAGAIAKSTLGKDIALSEKIARLSTFMSFVHHLDQAKFGTEMEMFRRAQELTDSALTGFKSPDRPMIVDKLGAAGELGYTFKSYLFNFFNNISKYAREAKAGNPTPLMSYLGMLAVVGGTLSMPLLNEADGMWNLTKSLVANFSPEHYNKIKGNGLKAAIMEQSNKLGSYVASADIFGAKPIGDFLKDSPQGLASHLTGAALQTRFGTDVIDPEKPFKNIFPVGQDIKELATAIPEMLHPTGRGALGAIYQQMPAVVKGQMETRLDAFKGPKQGGGQIALNPNHLTEPRAMDHLRTEKDETYRQIGMTSIGEAKDRQTGYINQQESKRIKEATDKLGEHLFNALLDKKQNAIQESGQAYLQLNPNSQALLQDINKRIEAYGFTPSQRAVMKANSYQEIANVIRLMKTRGQK